MHSKLKKILLQKQREVEALYAHGIFINKTYVTSAHEKTVSNSEITDLSRTVKSLRAALLQPSLNVIAEIKRQSPSKGHLAAIKDPVALAKRYVAGGASALSVLTDELFFNGKLVDLTAVAQAFCAYSIPVLRKDFVIDPIQIQQAYSAKADAVLLIVAVLKDKTKQMLDEVHRLGLEALVEVHHREELELAIACGAKIIGINNRDLNTFTVDTERAMQLIKYIPRHIVTVAESGIPHPDLAKQYYHAGFNAVLVGEALVQATHPEQFITRCKV